MERPLTTIIAGAGLMGRWRGHYARKAGATIAGIVDPDRGAAQRLARRHRGAAIFSDLASCLDRTPSQVVHVCTPLATHRELALQALGAGRHVMVEKPLASNVSQTSELLTLTEEQGLKITVAHQWPFQRGFRSLARVRGRLGRLVRVSFTLCSAGGSGVSSEEKARLLLEILPHPFSLLWALFGRQIVDSNWKLRTATSEDVEASASVEGSEVSIFISLRGRPTRNTLVLIGEKASCRVDLFHGFCIMERRPVSRSAKLLYPFQNSLALTWTAATNLASRALQSEWAYPGLFTLIQLFYSSIRAGCDAPVPGQEMLAVASLVERLERMRCEA